MIAVVVIARGILDDWGDPDRGEAEGFDVVHLLDEALEVATPFGVVLVKAFAHAIPAVGVIGGVAVIEAGRHDEVDGFVAEVGAVAVIFALDGVRGEMVDRRELGVVFRGLDHLIVAGRFRRVIARAIAINGGVEVLIDDAFLEIPVVAGFVGRKVARLILAADVEDEVHFGDGLIEIVGLPVGVIVLEGRGAARPTA